MSIGTAAAIFAAILGAGVVVWVLVFGFLLFFDYERGMRMLGGLAMFVRSVRKKPEPERPRRHQRADDDAPREHRRRSPSPPTIRDFAAVEMPQRRRSDPKPKPEEPTE